MFIALSSFISNTLVKDTLKAFDDFLKKQKIVWSNVFLYVKVCIFWKCIQYTTPWDKTQMLKKSPSDKTNGTKDVLFFSFSISNSSVLLLICDSYISWNARFVSLKLCVGVSTSTSVSFLLQFIFLFNKMHELFDFKTL